MKKLLILLVLCAGIAKAQIRVPDGYATASTSLVNSVVIKHHSFTVFFNQMKHEPDSVKWVLIPSMLNCTNHLARTNKFTADPQILGTRLNSDYNDSGYDQGHQFPAQDASCNLQDESECFYFSNMVPQRPNLNRITWKALEVYTRKIAATTPVTITCGIIGSKGFIGKDKVTVPAYCFKRLTYSGITETYIMPNADSVSQHNFKYYLIKK